jgi:hypothetical protein
MGRPGRYERQQAKEQNARARLQSQLDAARSNKQQPKQQPTKKAEKRSEQVSSDFIAAIAETAARTAAATAKAILDQQQGTTLPKDQPETDNTNNQRSNGGKPRPSKVQKSNGGKPKGDKNTRAGGKPTDKRTSAVTRRNENGQTVNARGKTLFDLIGK